MYTGDVVNCSIVLLFQVNVNIRAVNIVVEQKYIKETNLYCSKCNDLEFYYLPSSMW